MVKSLSHAYDGNKKMIKFGGCNWIVLNVQENRMLLLSYLVIERKAYDLSGYCSVSWEFSNLRKYLNGRFYITSFFGEEKTRIATTTLQNNGNSWYKTRKSNDTKDKIFLLSVEEVIKYLGDSGALANRMLMGKNAHEICDQYNHARTACDERGTASSWALRTPGATCNKIAVVTGGVSFGHINMAGCKLRETFGIRPALWVYR